MYTQTNGNELYGIQRAVWNRKWKYVFNGFDYDELYDLGDQARKLFDDELLENNPRDEYFKNLKEDISEYHDKNKTIASSAVDSSNDVEYKEVDGDDCAYVKASYFIKEGNAYSRTYQMYVLRKDADGNWKILVFYQVNGDSSDDE